MDDILVPFHRQYLQQITPSNIRYPSPKYLVISYVQDQIYRYFFDENTDKYLPPPQYQQRVLKRIISDIERELQKGTYDPEEYEISDALMSHMGALSAAPHISEIEAAQTVRTLSYFLPYNSSPNDPTPQEPSTTLTKPNTRILIHESPNLLAAGSNVGLRTWEASLHLVHYLCTSPNLAEHHPTHRSLRGSNVIELGAGTGLLSLICSIGFGAAHVLATDGLPHVVEGISKNFALNASLRRSSPLSRSTSRDPTLPTAALLDWTDLSTLPSLLSSPSPLQYDYILGADITYHPHLLHPLASTIAALKHHSPESRTLIAATVRNEATISQFKNICESEEFRMEVREVEWQGKKGGEQNGCWYEQGFPQVILEIE